MISDLVKLIGSYKHDFEKVSDLEKLNNVKQFQELIYKVFNCKYDTGMILKQSDSRLNIRLCFHNRDCMIIYFGAYQKYRKISYYEDTLILNRCDSAITLQRQLSEFILYDTILLSYLS